MTVQTSSNLPCIYVPAENICLCYVAFSLTLLDFDLVARSLNILANPGTLLEHESFKTFVLPRTHWI